MALPSAAIHSATSCCRIDQSLALVLAEGRRIPLQFAKGLMKTGTGTASNSVFHQARIQPVAEPVPVFIRPPMPYLTEWQPMCQTIVTKGVCNFSYRGGYSSLTPHFQAVRLLYLARPIVIRSFRGEERRISGRSQYRLLFLASVPTQLLACRRGHLGCRSEIDITEIVFCDTSRREIEHDSEVRLLLRSEGD